MSIHLKSEQDFLIGLVLDRYNRQFGRNLQVSDCKINSIVPEYGKQYGYSIETARTDDYLRFKVFLSLGPHDSISPLRLENDGSTVKTGSLEDEVFVAVGQVNRWYFDSGTYRFRWIGVTIAEQLKFKDSEGNHMFFMDGTGMEFMNFRG